MHQQTQGALTCLAAAKGVLPNWKTPQLPYSPYVSVCVCVCVRALAQFYSKWAMTSKNTGHRGFRHIDVIYMQSV